MSKRYGTEFDIISEYEKDPTNNIISSSSTQESEEQTLDADFVGLIPIDSIGKLQSLSAYKYYMPLENYLENNAIWNALPDDFKSLFEIDGHIYAIPTSVFREQYTRIIYNEALQETGITVIDLDSFRDFAVTYVQESGKSVSSYWSTDVIDILNAFGLYPGTDPYSPFNYDPIEGCYVDWMTKPAAVDALEYLRELYDAGALALPPQDRVEQLFQDGTFASKYDPYYDYDDCTEVLTLNSEYPQALFTTVSGFAMTEDTPQPQETVNLLVDMFFGSAENYLECRLGSSDNYTLNSDGTITIKMTQDSDGNYVAPCMPNLAGELSDIFSYTGADILYSINGVVTEESKTNAENYSARLELLEESLENGTVVEIPPKYQIIESATYDANLADSKGPVGFTYLIFFEFAINRSATGKTVQQWLDQYKEKMLAEGGNQMLDEMNAAIGKKTAYYYG